MTGWRVGMAVGNASLCAGLGKIKENVDSGIFQAVQVAGIAALEQGEEYAAGYREIYRERRDTVVAALKEIGIDVEPPKATFYIWAPTPEGMTSKDFCMNVLEKTGVVITPGNGFGAPGEGYFRISLTVGTDRLKEAVQRIKDL
jgi:LL-diaminopimelate aminotransferase